MTVNEKITALRKVMEQQDIDAWIIPSSDPHNSEYVASSFQGRKWISGFTGTAGTIVVLANQAGLWTDGRYHIQAATQLEGTIIDLYKQGLPETPSYTEWLADVLPANAVVGFDGRVITATATLALEKAFKAKKITILCEKDILDEVWQDRPALPSAAIFEHDIKYCGKSRQEKLADVRHELTAKNADYVLISALDDIAWLYNYRGNDIHCCPVAMAYTLVGQDKVYLCIDQAKVSAELKATFVADGMTLCDYEEIFSLVRELPAESTVMYDAKWLSRALEDCIPQSCEKISTQNITTAQKAIKNEIEIANYRNCFVRDGVYMVKFMKWMEDNVGTNKVTEKNAADYLTAQRAEDPDFYGVSFDTIPGYRANGAMMHYGVPVENGVEVKPGSFFLVDSGGLYSDGTTDITRTFAYGDLTPKEIRDFSLVLKGVINLSRAVFLKGTRGVQLDILARGEMWREGINYGCGTGHGVGFFLNVHEGPHNIGPGLVDEPFLPGMVVTNEPGIYREGEHGVRIENIMQVVESQTSEFGEYFKFETMTLCPIETKPIDKSLFTQNDIDWLNDYHKNVFEKLSPLLDDEHKAYLAVKTKAI